MRRCRHAAARIRRLFIARRRRSRERGVALLVVVGTLTLVASVVADFQFNSRIDLQLALNARDEVQAEYSALSALRLRALLLKNARQLDNQLRSMASTLSIDPAMLPPMGQLLELIPVDCALMSAVAKPAGASALGGDDGAAEGESTFPGECLATSKSEHAKISLPAMASATPGQAAQAQGLLLAFLSDPKMQRYFEEDDESGTHAESPQELVAAIVDWVDIDKNQTGNQVGDEDRHYAYLRDRYRAKNAPFDSISELQLVHGVSDALYEVLKDRVTVYNVAAQIELATAEDTVIAWGICSALRNPGDCIPRVVLSGPFWTLLRQVRALGSATFTPMKVASLGELLGQLALDYDPAKLGQIFTDRSSTTWYTIEAEGSLGNARKRVRAVYQTQEAQSYYYYRIE